jgi:UDP-2-acetamido-2,6-beta-L-arabino-hexul-4-ose reductase
VKVLVTGAKGFIAKNLLLHVSGQPNVELYLSDRSTDSNTLKKYLADADTIFHLAGVNRPADPNDFTTVNTGLTEFITDQLEERSTPYRLHYASSTQAALDNPYGRSKKTAEDYLLKNVKKGEAIIYRFPGIFGKWCKPNYNSVVATFCYNIANDLPVSVSNEANTIQLMYVDDVIKTLLRTIEQPVQPGAVRFAEIPAVYSTTLGELLKTLQSFKASRESLLLPDVGNELEKKLYSTYVSYLPVNKFDYGVTLRTDNRGSLFELLKTNASGQIFISTTFPGITRGNHYHHTKTEKFCVISGEGLIQFRKIGTDEIIEYKVSGDNPSIVDIPPGYTHNITNIGASDMVTLFWANEIFDPQQPDTYFEKV